MGANQNTEEIIDIPDINQGHNFSMNRPRAFNIPYVLLK